MGAKKSTWTAPSATARCRSIVLITKPERHHDPIGVDRHTPYAYTISITRAPMSLPARMTALLQPSYGSPDVLSLSEIDVPALAADGVLVRVVAAGLNKADWHLLTGRPYLLRTAFGVGAPKRPIAGMALAGPVVAVGPEVRRFQVGDAVCAEVNRGALAEYACAREKELAKIPAGVSFEDAATLPVAPPPPYRGCAREASRTGNRC